MQTPLPTQRPPAPPAEAPALVTVGDVARATGKARPAIRRALAGTPPAGSIARHGNGADAWHTMDLPPDLRDAADPYDLRALADMRLIWKDPQRPTDSEQARILDCAFVKLEALVQRGASERVMKARQIAWLAANVPALAANEEALRKMFNRYLDRWRNGGRKLAAIFDKRPVESKNRRAPTLPKADLDLLAATAIWKYGGRLDPAWRLCWPKLSEEIRDWYPVGQRVPNKIYEQVSPEIRRLLPWFIDPRAARLNGNYLEGDWSNVFAADWYSSDDFTLPVYFYHPENPRELTRGQFLPMFDVKSERVMEFAMEPGKSYTAATIRKLISKVCSLHGLPRKGFHFESGIWKNAKLLGGGGATRDDGVETFATRLGLRIMNSLPGNARAKIVERLGGILQDMMEGEPGYVGRDEMHVKYARVQKLKQAVEAGRIHPAQAGFYSFDQWIARLHEICGEYNARVRQSVVMDGKMCPDEAWEKRQPRDSDGKVIGVTRLPAELRYLLAAHKEIVPVGRAGIKLFNGKFRYSSEVTGAIKGESVIAWFDPERPETLAITDLNGENVRTIPRLAKVQRYDGWMNNPDATRASAALVNAHNGYLRSRISELETKYYPPSRAITVDPAILEKGREMDRQRVEINTLIDRQNTVPAPTAAERAMRLRLQEEFEKANEHLFA